MSEKDQFDQSSIYYSANDLSDNEFEESSTDSLNEQGQDHCIRTVKKNVSVAAEVTIDPIIEVCEDNIDIKCKDLKIYKEKRKKKKKKRKHCNDESCVFVVEQNILVKIPFKFGVDVNTRELGIICDSGNLNTAQDEEFEE